MPIRNTVAAFEADLRKFAELVQVDIRTVRRKVSLDLFEKVSRRSPRDTGRFVSSWAMSDTAPSSFEAPDGQASYPARGNVTASFVLPFDKTWVVNNLAYAEPLEFGHSKQAPAGMARIAVAEEEAEIGARVERLR
jgi:hypothetical protein